MATDFNAAQWAQINAPRTPKRNFDADFAEAVETREGLRSGMSPNDAMIRGMQAGQTRLDPFFEMKKLKFETDVKATALQMQENVLSMKIKQQQTDDEAADNLAYSQLAGLKTWEEKIEALSKIVPKSAKGIGIGTGLRLQLSQLRMQDWSSRAMLSIAQKNPALAMKLSKMDPDSPEFTQALSEAEGIDNKPKPAAVTLPSGKVVEVIYNAKGGGYTVVNDQEEKLRYLRESLGAKGIATLSITYKKEIAKLESEAADLERSTKERDKQDAAGLRAQAADYRQKLSSLGGAEAATPTATSPVPASAVQFIFKDGKLVPAKP